MPTSCQLCSFAALFAFHHGVSRSMVSSISRRANSSPPRESTMCRRIHISAASGSRSRMALKIILRSIRPRILTVIASASEAIHVSAERRLDCFVADAPRNDAGVTHAPPHSRGTMCPRHDKYFRPWRAWGRRHSGARVSANPESKTTDACCRRRSGPSFAQHQKPNSARRSRCSFLILKLPVVADTSILHVSWLAISAAP